MKYVKITVLLDYYTVDGKNLKDTEIEALTDEQIAVTICSGSCSVIFFKNQFRINKDIMEEKAKGLVEMLDVSKAATKQLEMENRELRNRVLESEKRPKEKTESASSFRNLVGQDMANINITFK